MKVMFCILNNDDIDIRKGLNKQKSVCFYMSSTVFVSVCQKQKNKKL